MGHHHASSVSLNSPGVAFSRNIFWPNEKDATITVFDTKGRTKKPIYTNTEVSQADRMSMRKNSSQAIKFEIYESIQRFNVVDQQLKLEKKKSIPQFMNIKQKNIELELEDKHASTFKTRQRIVLNSRILSINKMNLNHKESDISSKRSPSP